MSWCCYFDKFWKFTASNRDTWRGGLSHFFLSDTSVKLGHCSPSELTQHFHAGRYFDARIAFSFVEECRNVSIQKDLKVKFYRVIFETEEDYHFFLWDTSVKLGHWSPSKLAHISMQGGTLVQGCHNRLIFRLGMLKCVNLQGLQSQVLSCHFWTKFSCFLEECRRFQISATLLSLG